MHRTPWWPNTRLPAGSGPWPQRPSDDTGESGSIATATATAITAQRLCGKTYSQPTPVVLEIAVSVAVAIGSQANAVADVDFCAATLNAAATSVGSGFLTVQYGSGAASQTVRMDLRGGSYQLPACEQVQVSVTTAVDGATLPALSIRGALVAGVHPAPSQPTYTWRNESQGVVAGVVAVPARARRVDLWAANSPAVNIYGAGAPVLSLVGDPSQGQLIRDYALGVWAPPYPMATQMGGSFDGTDFYRFLQVLSTVTTEAVVQFELEL